MTPLDKTPENQLLFSGRDSTNSASPLAVEAWRPGPWTLTPAQRSRTNTLWIASSDRTRATWVSQHLRLLTRSLTRRISAPRRAPVVNPGAGWLNGATGCDRKCMQRSPASILYPEATQRTLNASCWLHTLRFCLIYNSWVNSERKENNKIATKQATNKDSFAIRAASDDYFNWLNELKIQRLVIHCKQREKAATSWHWRSWKQEKFTWSETETII